MQKALIVTAILAAVGGTVLYALPWGRIEAAPVTGPGLPDAALTPPGPPELQAKATSTADPVKKKKSRPAPPPDLASIEEDISDVSADRLALPNGKSVPILNGAFGAPPVQWPSRREYSPIVRVVRDTVGEDWYEHRDGSFTQTKMVYRSDLGRYAPVTRSATPEDPLPMDPDSLVEYKRKKDADTKKAGGTIPK